MEDLVDGVGTLDSVTVSSVLIRRYRHLPADNPESCMFAGSPANPLVTA
jgi:hypothetical protein